jgi:hypothetical protein
VRPRDFPAEHKVQQASDSLERFDTGFISDSIGLALNKEEEFICFLSLLPFLVPGYFEAVISRIFLKERSCRSWEGPEVSITGALFDGRNSTFPSGRERSQPSGEGHATLPF